jgi:hypothetical protein
VKHEGSLLGLLDQARVGACREFFDIDQDPHAVDRLAARRPMSSTVTAVKPPRSTTHG